MSDDGPPVARRPAPLSCRGAPPARPGAGPTRRPGAAAQPAVSRAAPNVAQVAAVSAWHLVSWGSAPRSRAPTTSPAARVDGEPATAIMQDAAHDLRDVGAGGRSACADIAPSRAAARPRATRPSTPEDLQQRGSDLLRRSNDVHVVEDTHPAFARILTEITPDEARILRYLYLEGPQPSVDVRTCRPFGIGSVLVAHGLTMIAEHAGLPQPRAHQPYLTNLTRLGLIDFSKEQVTNPHRYQVIEAQPKVVEALKRAGRLPRTMHRSIRLTSFGTSSSAPACR